jgi:hypothetical protein
MYAMPSKLSTWHHTLMHLGFQPIQTGCQKECVGGTLNVTLCKQQCMQQPAALTMPVLAAPSGTSSSFAAIAAAMEAKMGAKKSQEPPKPKGPKGVLTYRWGAGGYQARGALTQAHTPLKASTIAMWLASVHHPLDFVQCFAKQLPASKTHVTNDMYVWS